MSPDRCGCFGGPVFAAGDCDGWCGRVYVVGDEACLSRLPGTDSWVKCTHLGHGYAKKKEAS